MKTTIKKIWPALFIVLIISTSFKNDVSSKITAAIQSGNSRALAQYFHTTIDLTVLDNDGTYSRAQAQALLRDFFSNYPPVSFSINHQGASRDASQYYIGTYRTANHGNFRFYFLVKSFSGQQRIQNMEIQKQ